MTPRQIRFIAGLARGHTLSAIAARSHVCRSTVVLDLRLAAKSLGMAGAHAAVLVDYAYRTGLFARMAPEPRPPVRLTARRREVLELLATAASVPEIAARLCVSVDTVKSTVRCVYFRLGAKSRAHAVALGWQQGLLRAEPMAGVA